MQDRVAIIIPVYKTELTYYEKISLEQCIKILHNYDIHLICPQNLCLRSYIQVYTDFRVFRFHRLFFQSIHGYNSLLLRREFYRAFLDYDYVLIYQLDAFVFRDDLRYWCSLKIDYVGAPWVVEQNQNKPYIKSMLPKLYYNRFTKKFIDQTKQYVGNGGFSLRKPGAFLFVLRLFGSVARRFEQNEDAFWSVLAPLLNPFFRVPNFNNALEFSFETDPRGCYELNGCRLPFGCHAWDKYDIEFWRPHFRQFGYSI